MLVDASQQSQPNHMKGPCLHPPAAWSWVLTMLAWPPLSSGPGLQSMPSNQRPSHQDHIYGAPTVDRVVHIWALTISLPGIVFIVPIGQGRKPRVREEKQMHQDPAVGKRQNIQSYASPAFYGGSR